MYDAVELNKSQTATQPHRKSKIYLSKYNVVVSNGQMIVEKCNYGRGIDMSSLPQWARKEMSQKKLISDSELTLESEKQYREQTLE